MGRKRYPAQVSAMIEEADAARVDRLAEQENVSRGEVLRLLIWYGFPAVEAEYERRRQARDRPAAPRN